MLTVQVQEPFERNFGQCGPWFQINAITPVRAFGHRPAHADSDLYYDPSAAKRLVARQAAAPVGIED